MIEKIDSINLITLNNGLKVVIEEMPWLPSVSFNISLPLGAIGDPDNLEGSSVVLHEWLDRGAGERSSKELTNAINDLGIHQSSNSGKEAASFQASMLVDVLPKALELYADIARHPILVAEEFEPARTVALQELASLDDEPARRMLIALSRNYFASVHGRSNYGTLEGIKALTVNSVRQDYHTRISPKGTIISLAGGVKTEIVLSYIEKYFGDWQGEGVTPPAVILSDKKAEHILSDNAQTQIGVAFKAVAPDSKNWYENALAVEVLSGGMSSRLFREVREKRGLVYSVFASNYTLRDFGYILAYAGTTPDRADETLQVLLAELSDIYKGVTEEELERARIGILSSLIMQGESSSVRASSLARDTFLRGKPRSLKAVKAEIESKTLADVNNFLHAQPEPDFTVMTLGPKELKEVA